MKLVGLFLFIALALSLSTSQDSTSSTCDEDLLFSISDDNKTCLEINNSCDLFICPDRLNDSLCELIIGLTERVTTLEKLLRYPRGCSFESGILWTMTVIDNPGPASQGLLFAIDIQSREILVNRTIPGTTFNDIAWSPEGILYGVTRFHSDQEFRSINVTTGISTLIGLTGTSTNDLSDITGLVISTNGTVYGSGHFLYTIDPETGIATSHSSDFGCSIADMTFYQGRLLGICDNGNLLELNAETGDAIVLGNTGFTDLYSLVSVCVGRGKNQRILLSVRGRGQTYRLDPNTGAVLNDYGTFVSDSVIFTTGSAVLDESGFTGSFIDVYDPGL